MRGSLVVVVVLSTLVGVAHADDTRAAEAMFLKGKALEKDGKWQEACDAFAKSQAIDPEYGTEYNLAICDEQIGKLAAAWELFRELAQKDTNEARRKDSDARAVALGPRLTRLVITIDGPAEPGLVVTRDGVDVTKLVDAEDPIDPGTYHVVASAPGFVAWSYDAVASGEGQIVTVKIPALEKAGMTKKAPPPPPVHPEVAAVVPSRHHRSLRKPLAIGALGTGAIALGVGLYFGNVARNDWTEARTLCPDLMCNSTDYARGQGLVSDGRSAGNVSTALVVAGAVVAGAGLVLWLTTPHEHAESTALRVVASGAGVAIAGGF